MIHIYKYIYIYIYIYILKKLIRFFTKLYIRKNIGKITQNT